MSRTAPASASSAASPPDGAAPQAPPAQGGQAAVLPDKPRLAGGVRLAGQMQESAFEEPPWLLEREGAGYIQVTRLLHQIAEQANGENTLDDIARRVSQSSGRTVSADNVRQLMVGQLVPRGLIEVPGLGRSEAAGAGARSPLALNMRMRMIGPRAIDPITNVLRVLYWPPVLVGVLVAAAVAEAWVYVVHGVGGSVHDAIYAPGLMLVVLGAIVVSAGFHELGHAAALHYGGGTIKGMGAGLYIVYPAFFTDVSDNYRLGRWGRVRTDLGGFYFNLIFALGMLGLYLATGQEALLMIVVLVNLEIIHQLLPFVRLDGYWTLADLTGVPDFFSQMTAFLRSVLPFKRLQGGRKLPALKWWAKGVFGGYMLITIPLLGLLLLLMVKSVPRVLASVWDSAGQQAAAFGQAQAQGDVLGMVSAAGQVLLLALPTIGLLYTLYTLGRRVLVGVWNWSKPSAGRRVIAGLGTLVAAGLVAVMWAPRLPFAGDAPGPMYNQVRFEPIAANERGTLQDGVVGALATREPTAAGAAPLATETPPAEATAEPNATALADATAQASATAQPNVTPPLAGTAPQASPAPQTPLAAQPTAAVAPTSAPGHVPAPAGQPTAPAAPAPATAADTATATATDAASAPAQAGGTPAAATTPGARPTSAAATPAALRGPGASAPAVRLATQIASGTVSPTRTPTPVR